MWSTCGGPGASPDAFPTKAICSRPAESTATKKDDDALADRTSEIRIGPGKAGGPGSGPAVRGRAGGAGGGAGFKQANGGAPRLAASLHDVDEAVIARAFVRGPLLDVLSPLVGRGEAARLTHKLERNLAEERDWPIPEEDTLPGARRGSSPGNER